jgi:hypothetical protein
MHHSLGDGMSMVLFLRDFTQALRDISNGMVSDNVEASKEPPPILDNLMDPWWFQIIRALWSTLWDLGLKIHWGRRLPDLSGTRIGVAGPRCSNVKVDAGVVSQFRTLCKAQGVSMTSALITAALVSFQSVMEHRLLQTGKQDVRHLLPTHHGWVSTTDIRRAFLKPEEAQIFANFASDITEAGEKVVDGAAFWDIAKGITHKHRSKYSLSIERLMLVNYLFRRSARFRKFADEPVIADTSLKARKPRIWSIELANMGRFDADLGDLAIDDIFGNISPSFPINLALFTIGCVTVPSGLCLSATFDQRWVTLEEGELFAAGMKGVVEGVCRGSEEITVRQARSFSE